MADVYFVDPTYSPLDGNPFDPRGEFSPDWMFLTLVRNGNAAMQAGTGTGGVYQVTLCRAQPDWRFRLYDCIHYAAAHSKHLILAVDADDMAAGYEAYGNHTFRDAFLRPGEPVVAVHSTTAEAYDKVLADGALYCWNLLKRTGRIREMYPIGAVLGDPLDFSDYVMLDGGGERSELVVSSRQKGFIDMNADVEYTTGARLYFDLKKVAEEGLLVRDGVHYKVPERLPLAPFLICAVTSTTLHLPKYSTPRLFAGAADAWFQSQFSQQLMVV